MDAGSILGRGRGEDGEESSEYISIGSEFHSGNAGAPPRVD